MNNTRNMKDTVVLGGTTFLAGLMIGAGVGLVVAPHSGARTRRHMRVLAEDMKDRLSELSQDLRDATHRIAERSRRLVA